MPDEPPEVHVEEHELEEPELNEPEVESNEDILEGLAPLQPHPKSNPRSSGGRAVSRGSKMQREMRQEAKLNQLMPYTLSLTIQDVPQCEIVENAAFPPHERCSHEKVCFFRLISISMSPWAA
jgi:hypothetical protein